MKPLPDELNSLADSQRGLATRRQLASFGLRADAVDRRIGMGFWQQVTTQVVSIRPANRDRTDLIWAASLHFEGFALTGVAVLELAGLDADRTGRIDIIGPRGGREPPFNNCVVHTSRNPFEFAEALPRQVSPAVAVIHAMALARTVRQAALFATFAIGRRLTTVEELRATVVRNPHSYLHNRSLPGLAMLFEGAESMPERDFAELCVRHRLPAPVRQVHRVDSNGRSRFTDVEFWVNGYSLAVEIDGVGHLDPAVSADDRRKSNSLALQSVMVFRVTSFELKSDPMPFILDLKRAFAELRSRPPGPHPARGT